MSHNKSQTKQSETATTTMESLKDKQIVVTGGGRGLGLGMVKAFVARGAVVTVVRVTSKDWRRSSAWASGCGLAT